MKHLIAIASLVLLLAACASSNVEPPAPLVKFTPHLKVKRVWSASVGSADAILRLGIVPASDGANVYVAAHNGNVYAFALQDGSRRWKVSTKLPISAGPGVGQGMVVVGASDGTILALNAANGKQLWKTNVNGYILASPAVSQSTVVAYTTDGHIFALSPVTGQKLWNVSRDVPNLSLRGASPPVITGGLLLQGLDSGQLLAINLADGSQRWATTISTPSGSDDLSRLVDLDGVLAVGNDNIYAVNYQGRVAEVARDSGQILWSREMSSYTGVSEDDTHIYVTDLHSAVWALDKSTGVPAWTQPAMRARSLTVPVTYFNTVVAGDLQGYLHFLSKSDGSIVARVRLGSVPIMAPPIVVNGLLVVLTTGGNLAAYKTEPISQ
ncbi:MAG TPA: outer membrane protein assembly factor BamB [Gammaproteobacteria bacterium]|nr:outer membrane protein assembly factor BamB [Gammaproteobacteria bacterium]